MTPKTLVGIGCFRFDPDTDSDPDPDGNRNVALTTDKPADGKAIP
jgi:hypothetical protein